jgi:GntR family transcriptional regulator
MARRPAREIADALRSEILAGHLRPGDQLPSEHELARTFRTTRTSAQKAIANLRAEGHVISEHGRGSFVRPRPSIRMLATGSNYRQRQATGQSNFAAEAAAQGMRAERQLLFAGPVPSPANIAERLGLGEGSTVIQRRHLFLIEGEPMQTADAYYPADIAAGTPIARPEPTTGSSLAIIEDPHGPIRRQVARFIEDLDIRMPTPAETTALRIPPGVPIARVLRTAVDTGGNALEVLDSVLPADRYLFRYIIDVPAPEHAAD